MGAGAEEVTRPRWAGGLTGAPGAPVILTFTGADLSLDQGVGAQYYKVVVADSGDYTFTVNWEANGADIDMVLCPDVTCGAGAGDFLGTGVDQPESDVRTLAPGTYYFDAVLFAGTAPAWISFTLNHAAPSE